jgi:flagellar motor switch protein FliN/FliY
MAEDGPLSQADIDALTSGLLGSSPAALGFDPETLRPSAELILEQAATVLSTLLGRTITLTVREMRASEVDLMVEGLEGDGLMVKTHMEQGCEGDLGMVMRKQTAALLAGIMMGGDGTAPFKDEDLDAMGEMGNQIVGATCTALGARLGHPVSASQAQVSPFDGSTSSFPMDGATLVEADLTVEGGETTLLRLAISRSLAESLTGGGDSGGSASESSSGPLSTQGAFDDTLSRSIADSPPNIQMLLDINLNVTIELGRTRLSIRKILELGPGSIIELDRLAGEPVDLLVNDKVVAKGEVVVVDEYFGIRIISLVSPEERIKQLR